MKKIIRSAIALLSTSERRKMGWLMVLNATVSLLDIACLGLLLGIVHLYTQSAPVNHSRWLPDWLQHTDSLLPVLLVLALFILKNTAGYLIYQSQSGFVYQVASRIARTNLLAYLNSSYQDYVLADASVKFRQIAHQPIEFGYYIVSGLQQLFTEFVLCSIAVIAIFIFDAKLFLLLVLFLLPPVMIATYLTRRTLKTARATVKTEAERSAQYAQEGIASYIESNIYGRKLFFADRYSRYQSSLNKHLSALQVAQWMPSRFVEIFAVIALFILVAANKHGGHAAIDLIRIGAFMAAAYKIIPGIVRIGNLGAQIKTYAFTLADMKQDEELPVSSVPVSDMTKIIFRNIAYAYGTTPVLQHLNVTIDQGDFAAIMAPSGGGKTTMIHLLMGFLTPDSGELLINDQPADAAQLKAYWPTMAYIKQQSFLIHDTLKENITLGEKPPDEQRLNAAIQAAGLTALIDSFPLGLEQQISDSGKNISGGQRQRIAIARALYRDCSLLILDEPFSELDASAEDELLQYFQSLAQQGKMVILITHNASNLQYCNKIISLDEQ